MTMEVHRWLEDTSDWLFEYALDYFLEVEFPISPKLHTVDANNRVAVVSCDFWHADESLDYERKGEALDSIISSLGAIAYVFLFVGKVNNTESICVIGNGHSVLRPLFYYKPIIQYSTSIDFGPLKSISRRDSLEF